jgi:methionyl-tRNA formyltransferase
MRIILITQGISRIVMPFLHSTYTIIGIIDAAPRDKIGQKNSRPLIPWRKSLKSLSKKYHIPYYYMNKGSDDLLRQWVQTLNPDVIVVYSMSQLLKENIFALPKYGTINLHPSYLPKYRGPNPDFWMYYNMDLNPGVTVHYIDKGEDTGDIIYQETYAIPLGISSPAMLDIGINKIGVNLLFKALDNIALGTAPRIKQPQDSPTPRARNLKPEEHKKIINWDWPVERVWHILRGTELWLNVFENPAGIYHGHRWGVDNFVKCDDDTRYVYGGIYRDKKKMFVACHGGRIFISLHFNMKLLVKYALKQILSPPPPINGCDYRIITIPSSRMAA